MHEFPQAPIAVFSATQDEFVIRQAQALGAVGYVPKGAVAAEILGMLSALLWPQVGPARTGVSANKALFPRMPASSMYDRVAQLGPRHLEILELVLSGCNNQEISNAMRLSLGTLSRITSRRCCSRSMSDRGRIS